MTRKAAIQAAEAYLNQPLTQEWFEARADALFESDLTWEAAQKNYKTRGSLLTDMIYIEDLSHVTEDGVMSMDFGS